MNHLPIPKEESISSLIYIIRGEKVMLDYHLATLYAVETRILKQTVRRNKDRFPEDFMFELTDDEINLMVSQKLIPSKKFFGGARPFAFTEQGVAMLSSVLNSKRAISVNIQIIRVFTRMRTMIESHKEILKKLERLEKKDIELDEKVTLIFEYLKELEQTKLEETDFKQRKRIGFKTLE
jgi:ORF6N domain